MTISTRGILVFLHFDSMIIMLVGEFDCLKIALQIEFQLVVCFVRDGDGPQGWAPPKRTVANTRHGIGDGDGLQGLATLKRTAANARHGIGDGDRLQGLATSKRTVANARHGVGDGDGLQFAQTVFASR